MKPWIIAVALLGSMAVASAATAATREEAQAALSAATTTEVEAGKLGNRWLPAEAALKAAKAAFDGGDWDKAKAEADRAHACAARAIEQSQEQAAGWNDAVIR
jgi:hypothetical protein